MSGPATPAERATDDARALLDTMLAGGWAEVHVVADGLEVFIAREGGRANPMRAGPSASFPVPTGPEQEVAAPHVATLVDLTEVGTKIAAGERLATLRVLDDEEALLASFSGTITAHRAAASDLLEYGAPILTIAQADTYPFTV